MKIDLIKGNLTTGSTQNINYDATLGTPVAALIWVYSVLDTAEDQNDIGMSMGFYDGTTNVSSFTWCGGGPGNQAQRGRNTSNCINLEDDTPTVLARGTMAFDTVDEQIDLTFSTTPSTTYEYAIILFQGSDVSAAAVSHDGTDQTESIGFQPKLILTGGASTTSASATNGAFTFGGCDGSLNQSCLRFGQSEGTTGQFACFSEGDANRNMFTTTLYGRIQFDTFTTSGMNINFTGENGDLDEPGIYLALDFDNDCEVIEVVQVDSTNATQAVTTTFEPDYLFACGSVGMTASDTAYNAAAGAGYSHGFADLSAGVGGSGDYHSMYFHHDRRAGNAFWRMRLNESNLLYAIDGNSGGATDDMFANVSAKGSTSFTVNKSSYDTAARYFFISIGSAATTTNYTRTVSDSIGFTDTSSRSAAFGRSATDSFGIPDSESRDAAFSRASSDDAGFTDDSSRSAAFTRSSESSPGYTDSSSRVLALTRTTPDSFGFTDSSSGVVASGPTAFTRTVSESFGFTDTSARDAAFTRGVSDALGYTDTSSRSAAFGRSSSDSFGATDSDSRTSALTRGSSDSFGFVDTSSRTVAGEFQFTRSSSESFGMTDSASRTVGYVTPPITGSWYDTDYGNLASSAEVSYYGVELHDGKLAMSFTPDGSNAHTHFIATSEDAYAWTDYEVTGSLKRTDLTGIGVTVFSDYPNSDTYYRLRTYQSSNQWYITKHPDGQLVDVPVTIVSPTNQWVNYRIRVESGTSSTTIYAKLWVDGGVEPTGWQATAVDSDPDRITSGTVGYWAFGTSGGKNYHADLRINLFDGSGFRGVPVEGQGAVGTIGIFLGNRDVGLSASTTLKALSFAVQGTQDITGVATWRNSNQSVATVAPGSGLLLTASSPGYTTLQATYQGNTSEPVLVRVGGGASQTVTFGDFSWEVAEANVATGSFIGGDPYAVAPTGPISIIGYTPAPSVYNGRNVNGSMVNPGQSSFLQAQQGYTARDGYKDGYPLQSFYSPALDAGRPNGGALSWLNPLFLQAGQSHIVSSNMIFPAEESVIEDYGVLTVLSAAPASPSTTFRPQPYAGAKTLYTTADYNMAVLPEWDATAAATVTPPSFADVEALFTGTHIHAVSHWIDRYYRSMVAGPPMMKARALHWTRALLRLCCGANTSQKSGLLNKFLQLCIDQDGARAAGFVWEPSGGQMFGSKMLCYFKAKLFGETIPTDGSHWSTNSGGYYFDQQALGPRPFPQFQEDAQTFIVGVEHNKRPGWPGYTQYDYGTGQYTMPEFGGSDIDYGGAYWASPPIGILSGNAWNAAGLIYTLPDSLPGRSNVRRVSDNFSCLHGHYLFMWHIINSAQGTLEELRWRVD